jgi:FKBP-type peptidyl-prolyl cis-trans isomerase FklB
MKIKGLIVFTIVMAMILGSCAKSTVKSAKIKTRSDSLAYALGTIYYNGLMADSLDLNPLLVAKGMFDVKSGKAIMTDEEARTFVMLFINNREADKVAKQNEANRVLYKDYITENEEFLAKNKERPEVKVTESGLQYEVIKMGTGPKPTMESVVKVRYVGTFIDGTEFDSSIKIGEPAQFPLSGVIPGWIEALQLMPVGSKFKIYLPENLAYGASGAGGEIKPFSTLIFDVELLDIVE